MIAAGVLAGAVVLVYANSLQGPFVFDDNWTIRDQLYLRAPDLVPELYALSPPRFLVMLSFAVTYWLAGLTPWPYHGINIALHVVNCWLVYRLIAQWMPPSADGTRPPPSAVLCATLGFALTPVHTQVVSYMTGRAALLGTLWLLLTVLTYARSRRAGPGRARIGWLAASLGCYVLGGFSKEITSVAPALIIAWEWWGRAEGERDARARAVWRALPYFGILAATLLYRQAALGAAALPVMPRSVGINLLTQSFVTWRYALMEFVPVGLTIDHDVVQAHGWGDPRVWLGLGLWTVAIAAAWTLRRRAPWVTLGLIWFWLVLLPDSSVIPMQDIMADHRAYLPAIGLWTLVAYGWATWQGAVRRTRPRGLARAVAGGTALALGLLAFGTVHRNTIWRDPARLWREAVRVSPDRGRPLANLAGHYLARQRNQRAYDVASRAIELDDRVPAAFLNRGVAAMRLGRLEKAETDFASFLALHAWDPQTWITSRGKLATAQYNLGLVYMRQSRYADAAAALERALQLNPIDHSILNHLGMSHERLGHFRQAEYFYQASMNLGTPWLPEWNQLIRIRQIRSLEETLRERAVAEPEDVFHHVRLGIFYDDLGLMEQTDAAYTAAARTAPDEPLVPLLLGNLYRRKGRRADAIAQYRRCLELEPEHAEALWWLGQVRLAQGVPFAAQPLLERARALDAQAGMPGWRPPRRLRDGRSVKKEPTPAA